MGAILSNPLLIVNGKGKKRHDHKPGDLPISSTHQNLRGIGGVKCSYEQATA